MQLALGTAQFGFDYGISNSSGQINFDEAEKILSYAFKNGIKYIDTAPGYGEAEALLGRIDVSKYFTMSKVSDIIPRDLNVSSWLKHCVYSSLEKLKIDQLYGILLHRSSDLLDENGELLFTALNQLKSEGLIEKIGVSVYHPNELKALNDKYFDIVQLPMNILDRRFETLGWLDTLKARGTEIHVRSIFLQGLLLMNTKLLHPYFDQWSEKLKKFEDWTLNNGVSKLEACLGFLTDNDNIDIAVLGVQNVTQLKKILTGLNSKHSTVPNFFEVADENLINPANWRLC